MSEIDPHHICDTDPENGLCAVSIPIAEAAWKHAVEQDQAGAADWEELFPVLVSALGGVQHYLGVQLDKIAAPAVEAPEAGR